MLDRYRPRRDLGHFPCLLFLYGNSPFWACRPSCRLAEEPPVWSSLLLPPRGNAPIFALYCCKVDIFWHINRQPSATTSTFCVRRSMGKPLQNCPKVVQELSNNCPTNVHVPTMSKSCPKVVQILSNSCPKVVQKLSKCCPKVAQKRSNSCPKVVQKLSKI